METKAKETIILLCVVALFVLLFISMYHWAHGIDQCQNIINQITNTTCYQQCNQPTITGGVLNWSM